MRMKDLSMSLHERVNELNFDAEILRMVQKEGLSQETAEAAAAQYRNFLLLGLKYGRKGLTPSKLIDYAWHAHLEDTRKYMADCAALGTEFIHHDPKITGDRMETQFSYTKDLYQREFGHPLEGRLENESRVAAGCGY